MANVDYSCQEQINSKVKKFIVPDGVTVVGTGGFGAWAAYFSVISGGKRIVLINPTGTDSKNGRSEDIEGRELAIGPYDDAHLGVPKIDALEDLIGRIRPDTIVDKHAIEFEAEKHPHLLEGVVFAGVSNEEVYRGIWDSCAIKGLRCFGGTYNGLTFGVLSCLPESINISAYLPVWVGSAAISALLALSAAYTAPVNFFGSAEDLDVGVKEINRIFDLKPLHDC